MEQNLKWLEDPKVFAVNRLDAHSDHRFFREKEGDLTEILNGLWKVRVDQKPADRPIGFEKADYDAESWQDMMVPSSVQCAGLADHHYTNTIYPWDGHDHLRPPHISWENNLTVSYLRDFEVPETEDEVILEFNGVETAFYVWVNGELAGYAEDSFTPSRFNITKLVDPGQNRLAVQVFQRSSASWLEDQDMFRHTGIFRDVNLVFWPAVHIRDIEIRADLEKLKVRAENAGDQSAELEAILLDHGRPVSEWQGKLEKTAEWTMKPEEVHPWSVEDPYLYELQIKVKKDGETLEQIIQPVGFRTVEIEDGILKVNGRRIVFRGVNRHEFDPVHGRSLPIEVMDFDADMMKKLNINAVRTSHYPNHSHWYDLADQKGLWLIDETNMESHGSWQKLGVCEPSWNVPGNNPDWADAVIDRVKSMVARDKNHPSIVLWSLGNESYAGEDIVKMHDWVHENDPTRPVHYEGVFWNRDYDQASDVESRMYAKPDEIEAWLQDDPKKPYISCEYEHAMGNSLGNLDEYMALEKYPHYQGGFIWDYVDQAVESERNGKKVYLYGGDFGDVPNDFNFSGDGILLADRSLTPKAEELKRLYAPVQMEMTEDGIRIENQYAFRTLENCRFSWDVKKDNVLVDEGTFECGLPAGSTMMQKIEFHRPDSEGIWVFTLRAYDENGNEIGLLTDARRIQKPAEEWKPAAQVEGDGNFSFNAGGVSAFFQHGKGLISIKKDGREYLQSAVRPEVFRAFTDNDEGAGYPLKAGIWEAAQKYAAVSGFDLDEQGVTFDYFLPFVNETVSIRYEMNENGEIRITAKLPAEKNRLMLPVFGVRICMPEKFDQIEWMGQGPADTYPDRAHQPMGWYESNREAEFVSYLRPQEHGNHMETWQAQVSDHKHGLRFEAMDVPFQFSASAYSSEELQNADHPYELPDPYRTVVRILSEMQGTGGDDSWGAPVHPAYLLKNDQDLELSFIIRVH